MKMFLVRMLINITVWWMKRENISSFGIHYMEANMFLGPHYRVSLRKFNRDVEEVRWR